MEDRIANIVQYRIAKRIQNRSAGKQIDHRFTSLIEQSFVSERINHWLTTKIEFLVRRIRIIMCARHPAGEDIGRLFRCIQNASHITTIVAIVQHQGVDTGDRVRDDHILDLIPIDRRYAVYLNQ